MKDEILNLVFSNLSLVTAGNKDLFQGIHRNVQVVYEVICLGIQITGLNIFTSDCNYITVLPDIILGYEEYNIPSLHVPLVKGRCSSFQI